MFYQLENDYIKATVTDLGATLTKLIDKKTNIDMVLGFDDEEGYRKYNGTNIGASVGRNANRIGNAKFTLNGKEYNLAANNGPNNLHGGGVNGFAFKTWSVKSQSSDEIVFTYLSKDGEEGFPGNLNVEVSYKLDGNTLTWSYSGNCDQDTVFNMTNHSYFNLGEDDIFDLELKVHSDTYSPVDDDSLTLDKTVKVENTPFDFREFTKMKTNLDQLACGIDNNYVWEDLNDKLMAEVKSDKLHLKVYSDLPDMHLYTAYYLNGEIGKYNRVYKPYSALCLECQYYPNAINYENYIKPILLKGENRKHYIRYEVSNL